MALSAWCSSEAFNKDQEFDKAAQKNTQRLLGWIGFPEYNVSFPRLMKQN